jgi:hypothetical protein
VTTAPGREWLVESLSATCFGSTFKLEHEDGTPAEPAIPAHRRPELEPWRHDPTRPYEGDFARCEGSARERAAGRSGSGGRGRLAPASPRSMKDRVLMFRSAKGPDAQRCPEAGFRSFAARRPEPRRPASSSTESGDAPLPVSPDSGFKPIRRKFQPNRGKGPARPPALTRQHPRLDRNANRTAVPSQRGGFGSAQG